MIGFPIGLLASNAAEWLVHKYVLHGLGTKKKSFWSFHWHEHHGQSRRNAFRDDDYERAPFGLHAQGKELYGLLGLSAAVTPLLAVAPFFCAAVWVSSYHYYRVHKRAHLDPDWARAHLPWHYDHHMGPNQHANWCVTFPLFDHLLGTRVPYVGSEREAQDRARAERRQQKVSSIASPSVASEPSAA
jgi:sterol desaturase/sphingolipid hydroxylase (fatty acid hydroxylase superfamily)